jgi:hypothetical protein
MQPKSKEGKPCEKTKGSLIGRSVIGFYQNLGQKPFLHLIFLVGRLLGYKPFGFWQQLRGTENEYN